MRGTPEEHPVGIRRMLEDEVSEVVAIHMESFRGFFLAALGPRFLDAFYKGVLRDDSGLAFVAIGDREVLGFIAGSIEPSGFYRRLLKNHWWEFGIAALPASLKHPKSIVKVMRAIRHPAAQPSAPGSSKVFSVAVSPHFEGRGIGRMLFSRFSKEASSRGAVVLSLETDAEDNERVNAFYRSLGLKVSREYTTPEGRRMLEYLLDLDLDLERGAKTHG